MEALGINIGYLLVQLALFGLPIVLLVGAAVYFFRKNKSSKNDS
jgi:LPXTG-motif cell wall-anchored protein